MADLYTGKYLDGAGLNILWSKIKSEFAPAKNYAVRDEDNEFTKKNEFTHADGVTAKKFVVDGGTASQLLLADGTTKLVSYFATADHTHDVVYAKLGSANTFKETNTFQKAVTIGTTSVATVLLDVKGAGTFSDYVTAKGFKVGTQTGFLKANGTVDTNTYALSNHNHDGVYAPKDHNHDGVYQPVGEYATLGGDNTFGGINKFTNVAGVTAKKFVVDGGAGTNLLVDNGNLKPITDFATASDLNDAKGRISIIEDNYIKKDGSVAMDGVLKATSITLSTAITADTQATTKKYVDDKVSNAISALNNVIKLKGSVGTDPVSLPTSAELGDAYVVSKAGTYAGEVCEVGDMIVCTSASPLAWTIIQRNIPGVLTTEDLNVILD